MISASQIPLLLICPGQAVIDSYGDSSDAAIDGTREHEELLGGMLTGDLPDTPRGRALALVAVPEGTKTEVAVAIDLDNFRARVLPSVGHRDYRAAKPRELVGQGDLLAIAASWAGELKTGAVWVDSSRWNAQLWFFGLALMLLNGVRAAVRLNLYQVNARGSLRDDAGYSPSSAQLWQFFDRLARLRETVDEQREQRQAGNRLALVRGPHCRYCRAVMSCPAIDEATGDGNLGARHQKALAELARAQAAVEQTGQLLDADEYDLGDAKLVRRTKWRRHVNPARALEAIPALAPLATTRTTTSLTMGAVDKYAEGLAIGGTKKERREAMTRLLTDKGAIHHSQTESWEVR